MSTLIIDVGSSSVRALLFDNDGTLIPNSIVRRVYAFAEDATIDAQYLRQLVESCLDELLGLTSAFTIESVGMTTFVGNLLGVDENNRPLTPLYTYADTRSHTFTTTLSQSLDTQEIHTRTGCRIHAAYHPAKLTWLKHTQPELFSITTYWLDFATYCYREWFGRDMPCSYSIASWSGLLNQATLTWDWLWLDWLGLAETCFPILADYHDIQQGLYYVYGNRWPQLRDVPFYLAIGDGAAANIGSGGIKADSPVLTVGTTTALRIITDSPQHPPLGLWKYCVDSTHRLIGGAMSEGGNIFSWAKETLNLAPSTIEEMLLQRQPASHGLTILPLLAGERSLYYRASATGTIHGLSLHTTPFDILHALLESVALRVRLIFEALNTECEFILAGGGALYQSTAWGQIFADVLGYPLSMVSEQEITARGVFELIKIPVWTRSNPAPIHHHKQFFPRSEYYHRYTDLLKQQQTLYNLLYQD